MRAPRATGSSGHMQPCEGAMCARGRAPAGSSVTTSGSHSARDSNIRTTNVQTGVREGPESRCARGRKVTRSQGHKVTRSQGHKVTRSQGHKVTRSQGHKVTRSQGHKVTRSQGHKVTRSQGHKVTRSQEHKRT